MTTVFEKAMKMSKFDDVRNGIDNEFIKLLKVPVEPEYDLSTVDASIFKGLLQHGQDPQALALALVEGGEGIIL